MNEKPTYQKYSFSIIIAFFCLVIIGISLLPRLNVQLNPSRALPNLRVNYNWSDASARIIEKEVTSKLEGLFNSVHGVQSISSVTQKGSGRIDIKFKKNVNIDATRFEIASLIRQSYHEFPKQVSYPTLSLGMSGENTKPIITYTLNAATSPWFIQKYAEENISVELSKVEGLGEVTIYGATPYQWEIIYNTDILDQTGIEPNQVVTSINDFMKSNELGKSYYLKNGVKNEISLVLQQEIPEDFSLGSIPVINIHNRIIYLKDIAKIRYKEKPPNSYYRVNGLNTVNIVLYPENGVNHLKLAKKLKEKVQSVKQSLPAGYSMVMVYDESEFIGNELTTIIWRSLFSLLILFVFAFLLSRQFKYLFLIVTSILANLIIAVVFYYALGLEIHIYSLAGITISFGLIIDNSIVMIDHLRNKADKKVLLAIIAATLTTLGALCTIFLLKEEQVVNLIDFALVIIANLSVSVLIALYFIPALMEKVSLKKKTGQLFIKRKRRIFRYSKAFQRYILFSKRFRIVFVLIAILGFGIPIHWLPDKLESEGFFSNLYNKSIGDSWFIDGPKPIMEKMLGGTLRLFTQFVFENSYYSEPERTTLHVRGSMPEGCTLEQLNEVIKKMEQFISQFDEVETFNTSITSYRNSSIAIYFKEEHEFGSFPFYLKSELESKAISLGGLDWSVSGVGRGFSNALNTGYKNSRLQLEGYNYDQLYSYAEFLKQQLLQNPRIKEVDITGPGWNWNSQPKNEYYLGFHDDKMAVYDVEKRKVYNFIRSKASQFNLNPLFNNGSYEDMVLKPQDEHYDVWNLNNAPVSINERVNKFKDIGFLNKRKMGNDIHKKNQQYIVEVAYDLIGPELLAKKVRNEQVKSMSEILPLGYKISEQSWQYWNKDDKDQYFFILLIVIIIYIICSILFESLKQPLAIISLIPISFIGIFLTFYLFDINFDQGGFASFIMVSGLVVNSGIYIINDFNNFRKKNQRQLFRLYVKAFNYKIMPIILTILSSVLGLIPFLWGGQHEVFWYSFAAGTIGGLVFSLIAVILYLPLFLNLKKSRISV